MAGERWATFDCYGTLIDWNLGIVRELERLFGVESAPRLLACYHRLEPVVEREEYRSYAEVLTLTLVRLAQDEDLALPEGEADALARSLAGWPPFEEVPGALAALRARGWLLAILSNSDRAQIAASQHLLRVPFDLTIVAEDVRSYKPAHAHWSRFTEITSVSSERHVHVGASLFHDIGPANELGVRSVWINRLGERVEPRPARELTDLRGLPDALEELVPA
jgi:2-haloacid dehalogenase